MAKVKHNVKPSLESREPKSSLPKQHPHMHPLHKVDGKDHRDMSMPEKYNQTGPHLPMPDHQHEMHHPHTDVSEKHHSNMEKGSY